MDDMEEVIGEFLVESHENLDRLDGDFIDLEREPGSREILASIFRTIHTIKGTSGFLGFSKLESVTHQGENLLSLLRDGVLQLSPDMTTALLHMVDEVRTMLAAIESDGNDGDGNYDGLVATLAALASPEAAAPAEPEPAPAPAAKTSKRKSHPARLTPAEPATPAPELVPEPEPELVAVAAAPAPVAAPVVAFEPVSDECDDDEHEDEHEHDPAQPAVVRTDDHPTSEVKRSAVADSAIRVDVSLLDRLMNLVGELVLARNQILQFTTAVEDSGFVGTTQRLNLITTELQEGVMKTRMQPIGTVWSKFPRVVRDLAIGCGKQIRIEMEGKETELDKTIIEAIKDPLTHLVRNSVDHGIELPEIRRQVGKPEEGLLRLRAFHEGGQVNIEIVDDGGGIDPERIKRKAVEKGLLTVDQAGRLTEHELINLIFQPGFSTAEKVTNVSGRGVGMDVVKTNIEKIGGILDLQSRVGEGTTLKIKIPLTLAIIPALIVTSEGDRYAIPQVSLLELARLEGDQLNQIEHIGDVPVYRLRGRLLPLVFLREVLGYGPPAMAETDTSGHTKEVCNIVVLQADGRQFGLVVEGISDTEEIVVKPLGRHLKGINAFAGTTIMGDGTVALILDVLGIAQSCKVVSENREAGLTLATDDESDRRGDMQTLLVCRVGAQRVAIPLSLVARLEEFARSTIERAAGREVVQYRGQLLHLIDLSMYIPGAEGSMAGEADPLQVLVFAAEGHSIGLVVDQIVDIVEESVSGWGDEDGRLGVSGVIGRRVTDLIDVTEIIRMAEPGFFDRALSEARI